MHILADDRPLFMRSVSPRCRDRAENRCDLLTLDALRDVILALYDLRRSYTPAHVWRVP